MAEDERDGRIAETEEDEEHAAEDRAKLNQ